MHINWPKLNFFLLILDNYKVQVKKIIKKILKKEERKKKLVYFTLAQMRRTKKGEGKKASCRESSPRVGVTLSLFTISSRLGSQRSWLGYSLGCQNS